ncbi:glycosyltransferase family 39 protein [Candidatus Dependentiae bacterium]|nr:glycosyltransferase family 39 protein [Candidatus Dependentiae bacterium]MBU4387434.1 glycosyltransferase family 39 protein [Candidatus Dependentiae bacterium]MCG2756421.1 glycosyltransferase family 39 protein [Candidatus Dependentiae bacterium]
MSNKSVYLLAFSIIFLFFSKSLYDYVRLTNFVDPFQDIDSKGYIYNAEKFYKHNSFFIKNIDETAPYFSLGYPLFLGVAYKIFKPESNIVIWLQILLSLFTCFLIFHIAKIIWGVNVGIIAFALSAVNIGFITFSNFILTETLLTFLLTSFIYFFVLFLYKSDIKKLIISGLILGLSIFIKPAALYFVFPIIIVLFFANNYKIKNILLFCLSFYLPVFSYAYFNKIVYKSFSVSTLKNESLYFYLYPKAMAVINKTSESIEQKNVSNLLTGSKIDSTSWNLISNNFKRDFDNNKLVFVKIWLKNVAKTFLGLYSTNLKVLINSNINRKDLSFFKKTGSLFDRAKKYIMSGTNLFYIQIIAFAESIWSLLRLILILISLIFVFKKRDFKLFFFLFFYIFYFAFISGHDGCARFRMMFEPVLIILAAQGLYMIYFRLRYKSCPFGEL